MNFTNVELWNALRAKYPSFKSHTAEATADLFTEKGFTELSRNDINALNEYFELSMRVVFQKIDLAKIKTRLQEAGLVENYSTPMGGYTQRISIEAIAPVSPAFSGLVDGSTVDPFVVRKPKSKERFFGKNFDYQNLITIQEFQAKQMFIGESSMSEYLTGLMNGLELGYRTQLELNIYECLHTAINSSGLQATQKIALSSWTDAGVTDAELKDFIAQAQDLGTAMDTCITESGWNENKFKTGYNKEDFVMLVRAGIKNKIKRQLMVGAYNPDNLTIPFEMIEVNDFGGVKYYFGNYPLYPHYDSLGAVDGWALSDGGAKEKELDDPGIRVVDLDANVLAVVAQKGVIFTETQNGYAVKPIYNPRGEYTNYFANSMNNGIKYDKNYGLIVITKPALPEVPEDEIPEVP